MPLKLFSLSAGAHRSKSVLDGHAASADLGLYSRAEVTLLLHVSRLRRFMLLH